MISVVPLHLSRMLFIPLILGCLVFAHAPQATAWTELSAPNDAPVLTLEKGRSTVVQAGSPFAMIVVADPFIAEAMVTTNQSFFVRGAAPGSTTILLYDDDGRLLELIDVQVSMGLDSVRRDFERLLPGEDLIVFPVHDGILLDGRVTTAAAADLALQIAEKHVPGGVVSGLTIEESQQVLLEVRFVEAGRDVLREIGFGLSYEGPGGAASTAGGLVSGLAEKAVATFTGVGGEALDIRLSALESNGVLRTLAKPNLVALSGDTASFLAGGEFPIPYAAGDGEVVITFRQFGVSLDFTPTVLGDGLINLQVRPEVSSLDSRNGVRSAGFSIPALAVRRADASVELRDGQAFAIAGLLQSDYTNESVDTPVLSKIPILGALFSSKRYQRRETELVIIVTPRLVQPAPSPYDLATPLDDNLPPNSADFFLMNQDTHWEPSR